MPDVSYVVILTRGTERAAAALRSIAAQEPDSELLLVLNEADDAMRELAHATPDARVLHDGADLGIVLGWNLGLREAAAPHVCIVHEDSELQPGCAARLLETLRERPDAGAVGPRHLWTDGSVFDEGGILWSDGAVTRCRHRSSSAVIPSDSSPSACLMLDRNVARAVGGFDERFFPAVYVDIAMGCAVWHSGHTVLSDLRATNVHHTAAMLQADRGPRRGARFRRFLLERNRARFQSVWADRLTEQAHRGNTFDASRPDPEELVEEEARLRARELRILAGEIERAPERTLALPADLEEHVRGLRRELEDEFLEVLVDREASLDAELVSLHETHAEQASELTRVHRAYAELLDECNRLKLSTQPTDMAERLAMLQSRAATLDAIEAGNWWRLRTRLSPVLEPVARILRLVRRRP